MQATFPGNISSGSTKTKESYSAWGTTLSSPITCRSSEHNKQLQRTSERAENEAPSPGVTEQYSLASGSRPNTPSRLLKKNPFALGSARYFPQHHKKNLIVLHFTAGRSCESAYRTWQADPRRIGTAFGVDPDGTVAQFFPPEAWAYHLGIKGTISHDQRSIGIEIANVGPLRPDVANPNQLNWWPRQWGTPFCNRGEIDRYITYEYRGMDYFAAMPTVQVEATSALILSLCDHFGIPKVACESARQGEFDPNAFSIYQGVASHSNFRQDKWDVGPAFPWDCLGF